MKSDILIEELKKGGLLGDEQADKAKREIIVSGRSLEEIVADDKIADETKFNEIKSRLLKVPYQKVDAESFNSDVLSLMPEETARTYRLVPLQVKDGLLIVGMVDPDNTKAQDALKFVARQKHLNLGAYLVSYSDWRSILGKYSPYRSGIAQAVQQLKIKGEGGVQRIVGLEEGAREEGPIIKIIADTFREAVEERASDIHIEPQERYLRIRFRVDGELREAASLPVELASAAVSRVKVVSSLKIDETRIPQDGRFRAKVSGRQIDFRVATFPTPLGEKVAIRVLDPSTGLKTFDNLGLVGKNLELVRDGLKRPFGMVLITGPTGSGKTTTLYALLQILNNDSVNIVSLEDPVEYFVAGVNQSQVRPEIGYDFASGLRQILRQDPDIIMVGEIRDNETAGLAIQAALTGHIVVSTLHTNNAAGVIPRLIDMKVEPFLIPSSLNLMVSQRLVGLLCNYCKKNEEASPLLQNVIKKSLADLPKETAEKYAEPYKIYHSAGCDRCRGRGTLGRIALFEAFRMTPELEEIINGGPSLQKILKEAKRQGMLSLRQDGILKALEGLVSLESVIRETEEM